ncbi:Glutathione peroxidase [Artemisia annua]|uniref:Glutathione peroxidase n=1 Tax=Artemisia annua TaxID=35608 RepID=A0A2U1NW43_ARTAN|nr:Glutathione peroxidase [Artemisia annua]
MLDVRMTAKRMRMQMETVVDTQPIYKDLGTPGMEFKNVQYHTNEGHEILAFPCNQFLNQEPQSSEKVVEFSCSRFNADCPIFQKVVFNYPLTCRLSMGGAGPTSNRRLSLGRAAVRATPKADIHSIRGQVLLLIVVLPKKLIFT